MVKKEKVSKEEQVAEPERAKPAAAAAAAAAADAIIEAMPDALIVLDLDGVIVNVNPAMTKIFGYTPEERIGKSFDKLTEALKPEDIEKFVKLLGELMETGKVEPVETVLRTKDGREIPTSVTYSLIKDAEGNPKKIVAILRDITELKRAEEEWVAALRKAADTIEAIPDPLLMLSLDGEVLSVNSAHLKLLGLKSPEEVTGKSFDALGEYLKAEEIEKFMKLLGKLIETGYVEPVETVIRAKDGREISISVGYSLIKDAEGNPKNIIAVLRDITEIKKMEEERVKAVSAVAADKARAEEAEKFTKQLEAKVKDLEEFRDLAVGRELKMKKMEEEMDELKKKLKEKQKEGV